EILVHRAKEIGISTEKATEIKTVIETVGPEIQKEKNALDKLYIELDEVTSAHPIDGEAASAALARVLEKEAELKQRHFAAMIEVMNGLTAEQMTAARKILANMPPPDPALHAAMMRLKPKFEEIKETVESNALAGTPPPEDIHERMEKAHMLLKEGDVKGAEGILDELLNSL
ncbi:MAG: periplasmic heavy metal sensor, partial [Verrucomicrobiota bacterium]